jgi:hypothetical protein
VDERRQEVVMGVMVAWMYITILWVSIDLPCLSLG